MAYTLNIDFAGLCLFVPQAAAGTEPARMQVVLPAIAHDDGEHSMDRHVPLLVFDSAHLSPNTVGSSVADVHLLLQDLVMNVPGAGANLCICPHVVDLSEVAGPGTFQTDVLGDDNGLLGVARVDLRAGRMSEVHSGACWRWGTQVRHISHRVRWTIDVDSEDPLTLQLDGWHGTSAKTLTLHPLTLGGTAVINLAVHHSPPGDLPPDPGEPDEPAPLTPAAHFHAFYSLFAGNVPARVPFFHSTKNCVPPAADGNGGAGPCDICRVIPSFLGGSPYTCMVAGYSPPPV